MRGARIEAGVAVRYAAETAIPLYVMLAAADCSGCRCTLAVAAGSLRKLHNLRDHTSAPRHSVVTCTALHAPIPVGSRTQVQFRWWRATVVLCQARDRDDDVHGNRRPLPGEPKVPATSGCGPAVGSCGQ